MEALDAIVTEYVGGASAADVLKKLEVAVKASAEKYVIKRTICKNLVSSRASINVRFYHVVVVCVCL